MQVLRARPEDIEWIAAEMKVFASSLKAKHGYIPQTEESLHAELAAMQADHVLLVAWDRGDRVGTIGGMISTHPYNSDVSLLLERFWWVPEQNRGSRAGYMLLREFSKLGEGFGLVTMSLLPNSPPGCVKALERLGFRHGEDTFIKEQ